MKRWILAFLCLSFGTPVLAAGNLARVEVYDRASNRVLPEYYSGGRHYVAGSPGHEYSIRLRNQSGEDLLAVVSVDGVNVVTGETASFDQGGYILGRGQRFDIKGWRKSLARVAAFYFSRIDDSYAARTGRAENVGVIGVALYRRKVESPAVEERTREGAAAEPHSSRAEKSAPGPATDAVLGTGHGRSETSVVRYAQFERASETPEETISIYYDSHANLVARGIIREERPHPDPFPSGFVPDPPNG